MRVQTSPGRGWGIGFVIPEGRVWGLGFEVDGSGVRGWGRGSFFVVSTAKMRSSKVM